MSVVAASPRRISVARDDGEMAGLRWRSLLLGPLFVTVEQIDGEYRVTVSLGLLFIGIGR